MSVITVSLMGRWGNQVMQYLFARAYAEKYGHEFQCDPWIGSRVFELQDAPVTAHGLLQRNEFELTGQGDVEIRCYAQSQAALLYTKSQAQRWLKIRAGLMAQMTGIESDGRPVAHRRVGDYAGYGYPIVSALSYYKAYVEHHLGSPYLATQIDWVTEEDPLPHAPLPDDLSFLPDFVRLMRAPILLRGNSSFSWVAGLLGNGRVFSPVVDGMSGGMEHDVQFVEGNWPRFCNLNNITDLHLPA